MQPFGNFAEGQKQDLEHHLTAEPDPKFCLPLVYYLQT